MRYILAGAILLAIAGCATNPLQGARFGKLEECAGSAGARVNFRNSDGTVFATVGREACASANQAFAKIKQQAGVAGGFAAIANILTPNAFVSRDKAGDAIVVVTMGMLQALGDEEASWAGLLGHELAHLRLNHADGRKEARSEAQAGGQIIGTVLGQLIPGIGGFIASNTANFVVTNAMYGAYTRPQETEADELGMRWMVGAGYDPRGMQRFFETLRRSSALPPFLSTHPAPDDRIQAMSQFAAGSTPASAQSTASAPRVAQRTTPVAATTCGAATSKIRLQTLCITPGDCEQEIASIKRLCSNASHPNCVTAYQNVSRQCSRYSERFSNAACEAAADVINGACQN